VDVSRFARMCRKPDLHIVALGATTVGIVAQDIAVSRSVVPFHGNFTEALFQAQEQSNLV
jgi:hypothetical protein